VQDTKKIQSKFYLCTLKNPSICVVKMADTGN